jgi:hypothetical protein
MDNIKVFALLHTQKTGSFYEIFSTILIRQPSLLFHQKLMEISQGYYLKLMVGISAGKISVLLCSFILSLVFFYMFKLLGCFYGALNFLSSNSSRRANGNFSPRVWILPT